MLAMPTKVPHPDLQSLHSIERGIEELQLACRAGSQSQLAMTVRPSAGSMRAEHRKAICKCVSALHGIHTSTNGDVSAPEASVPEAGAAIGAPEMLFVRFLGGTAGVAGGSALPEVDSRLCTVLAARGRAVSAASAAALTDSPACCLPARSSTYMKHANVSPPTCTAEMQTLQCQARRFCLLQVSYRLPHWIFRPTKGRNPPKDSLLAYSCKHS